MNANALPLDGELTDPFGGAADLAARHIRFVGLSEQRMREDYLRILRWLRSHATLSPTVTLDPAFKVAAKAMGAGPLTISRERVWAEMRRIFLAPGGLRAMWEILNDLELGQHLNLPPVPTTVRGRLLACHRMVDDPVALLVVLFGSVESIAALAMALVERGPRSGLFLTKWLNVPPEDLQPRAMVAPGGAPPAWVAILLRLNAVPLEAEAIDQWEVPPFPVTGDHLHAMGVELGPAMGEFCAPCGGSRRSTAIANLPTPSCVPPGCAAAPRCYDSRSIHPCDNNNELVKKSELAP